MSTEHIFSFIGGLGFFFFGMKTMSDGLKKIAGDRLKSFLHKVTKNPISGVTVGALVTMLVQSSSATTVMVVGFVNAGMLNLSQAISVVIGANIGTTFTAWIVSLSIFKITAYALPAIGVGFFMTILGRTSKVKNFGVVVLGFGLLFIGLDYMKDAFGPLKSSEFLKETFVSFSDHPIKGVLVGIVFTVLLQSSSATITITQLLAASGVISLEAAIPIILGDNIGTTITAQLAAIGGNINARRTAMSHTFFNVLGTAYILVFVYLGLYTQFIEWIIPGELSLANIMIYIAVAHTAFNVINTIIFTPLIGVLERVSIALVPQKGESIDYGTQYLEKHLLDTPSLALEQTKNEVIYMLKIAKKAVTHAAESFINQDSNSADKACELEDVTDTLQSEITQYIVELSQNKLTEEESKQLPVLIHIVNDLERIGDHAQNIAQMSVRRVEDKLKFSDSAIKEVNEMWALVQDMFVEADCALKNADTMEAKRILSKEEMVNNQQEEFKTSHIRRLNSGECQMNSGFVFVEVIDNLEKVADRLANVGQSVLGHMQWDLKRDHT